MDGYEVKKMSSLIPGADIIITTTGNRDIVTKEYFLAMKDKAIGVI